LESLKKQTFQSFEVLIIDDGSKDKSREAVLETIGNENKYIYIYKENGGKHTAINVGIDSAEGNFFMILDSDDWLVEDALEKLYLECEKIRNNDTYCGVLARAANGISGELLGNPLNEEVDSFSYIDLHFKFAYGNDLGDCCEVNKTTILKRFRFPERNQMHFVPEAWLFDQIGKDYQLLYCKDIVKYCEYLDDGITKNLRFKEENIAGYLYHYVSRIENIIPSCNLSLKIKIVAWWRYWSAVKKDIKKEGPRVKQIGLLGSCIFVLTPLIDLYYKVRYTQQYKSGR